MNETSPERDEGRRDEDDSCAFERVSHGAAGYDVKREGRERGIRDRPCVERDRRRDAERREEMRETVLVMVKDLGPRVCRQDASQVLDVRRKSDRV